MIDILCDTREISISTTNKRHIAQYKLHLMYCVVKLALYKTAATQIAPQHISLFPPPLFFLLLNLQGVSIHVSYGCGIFTNKNQFSVFWAVIGETDSLGTTVVSPRKISQFIDLLTYSRPFFPIGGRILECSHNASLPHISTQITNN